MTSREEQTQANRVDAANEWEQGSKPSSPGRLRPASRTVEFDPKIAAPDWPDPLMQPVQVQPNRTANGNVTDAVALPKSVAGALASWGLCPQTPGVFRLRATGKAEPRRTRRRGNGKKKGRAGTLPSRIATRRGARVALQRSPILRAGRHSIAESRREASEM